MVKHHKKLPVCDNDAASADVLVCVCLFVCVCVCVCVYVCVCMNDKAKVSRYKSVVCTK